MSAAWIIALIIVLAIAFLINKSADQASPKSLSDLQITACTAADNAGTCTTNLAELGLVLAEECCGALGKCCP